MAHSLRPLFVTVTWGAGGSTAAKSLELAEICQRQLGLTTCLHLTCTNMRASMVDEALETAKELGIRNILALRGDKPRDREYGDDVSGDGAVERKKGGGEEEVRFTWAVDLVRYIRAKHADYFCVGVAGYPEGHADESHPTHESQSVEHDLPYLVKKVRAGADFIMTQLTYDVDAYASYEERLRNHESGAFKDVVIVPGLMPVQSYQILKRVTKLSHARIPQGILDRIEKVKADDEAVKKVGVDVVSEIVESIKALRRPLHVPRGFHFYTLNLEKSVAFILERCHLIPPSTPEPSPDDSESDDDVAVGGIGDGYGPLGNGNATIGERRFSRRRASSVNAQPHNRIIVTRPRVEKSTQQTRRGESQNQASTAGDGAQTSHEAPERGTGIPASKPTRKNELLISEGQGSLGREATWDDFPNGRWGPSNSPAFGEIDGYGPSLKVGPVTARELWGKPRRREDVTEIFRRHVCGEVSCVPWSDEVGVDWVQGQGPLRAETNVIRKELLALIEKGYWTVASQPAVSGVKNDDPVFGWGPPGQGFVFQKAFVEFFCARWEWEVLRDRLLTHEEEEITWLKTDAKGDFESSGSARAELDSGRKKGVPKALVGMTGVNTVTWGVFRGKEIVTPTIIEEQSFRAWGEEAFGIWEEWRTVFPRGSEEERFLRSCGEDVVLVNVVGQQFVGEDAQSLWEILG
jgi:methylenetetrahydrofolate reductase (NADPH)